ncbi:MAG: hypothetical protein PVF81_00190 [Thioalkalispiraceae bacterium]|jgi:hypothetical protein
MQTEQASQSFLEVYRGSFSNMLRWHQLDDLFSKVRQSHKAWYIYAIGEPPPEQTVNQQQLEHFLGEITALLHKEHQEDYCGIVYADDREDPSLIKIYDPNNLGVSCGFSTNPPLPGWILSVLPPADLEAALPQTGSRKRWWQRIFSA